MKVYSIGRESSCNIVISDRTDVVSRRHATLNVTSTGKMTIVDQSQNGTYVNGMRIASNVPFPVTRKDSVSFAHVARLDWNLVPNPFSPLRYAAMGVIALIVIAGAAWGGYALINGSDAPKASTPVATDTTNVKDKSEEDIKKAVMDSIEKAKAVQDSIAKAKQDSINKAKKAAESKKKPSKKSDKTKVKKEEPAKENKPQEGQQRLRI